MTKTVWVVTRAISDSVSDVCQAVDMGEVFYSVETARAKASTMQRSVGGMYKVHKVTVEQVDG